jgi:hypothetical protein
MQKKTEGEILCRIWMTAKSKEAKARQLKTSATFARCGAHFLQLESADRVGSLTWANPLGPKATLRMPVSTKRQEEFHVAD